MVRNPWLRIVIFSLVMFGLMIYPHATTSAHSPALGIVAPMTERPGASAVGVDAATVKILHYHLGFIAGTHVVPLDWYHRTVKDVGWGHGAIDERYHFCTDPPGHYNLPECRGLTPPGQ